MDFDPAISFAGLLVGFVVGLTGMGGGALMTPVLVILFKIHPLAAVSSDLVASLIMKPVGAAVHMKKGKVHYGLVRWLLIGAVPTAFAGAWLANRLSRAHDVEDALKLALGVALLVAVAALSLKSVLSYSRSSKPALPDAPLHVRPWATLMIGLVGGTVVGITSVGSGSLMMVLLLLLYPRLKASELVGTDLVQAVPLVGAAAFGHLLFGDVQLGLTFALIVGAIPGVYLGARLSARAPDHYIRPPLMTVLLASGLKLLGVPSPIVALAAAVGLAGLIALQLATRRRELPEAASISVASPAAQLADGSP